MSISLLNKNDEYHLQSSDVPHFEYLDSLRGLAIIGVIIVHSYIVSGIDPNTYKLLFFGQRGVQLFYIVSAFTLFNSMSERQGRERFPKLNFFIRRVFRIGPMFYLAIMGNIIYLYLNGAQVFPLSAKEMILGLLFLHGWDQNAILSVAIGGWSVADEFSFYLIFPIIFSGIRNFRYSLLIFIASAAIFPLISALFLYYKLGRFDFSDKNAEYFFFYWFPIQFPVFILGVATYYASKIMQNLISDEYERKFISFFCFILGLFIITASMPTRNMTLYLSSLGLAFVVLSLSINPFSVIVNSFTIFLGKISYSVYLIHFFLIIALHTFLMPFIYNYRPLYIGQLWYFMLVLIFTAFTACICAFYTYRYIELPSIRAGKELIVYLNK